MPIDEYSKQLLPESKSTQIGHPAWTFVKYYVLAMLQLILLQSALYFRHLYYFHEIMFFKALSYFKALSAFKALIYFVFIEWQTYKQELSKRFQLSKRFCSCISAFLFLHKGFCFIFYVSQHLYIFLTVSQRAILLSFPNCHAAIISIS